LKISQKQIEIANLYMPYFKLEKCCNPSCGTTFQHFPAMLFEILWDAKYGFIEKRTTLKPRV